MASSPPEEQFYEQGEGKDAFEKYKTYLQTGKLEDANESLTELVERIKQKMGIDAKELLESGGNLKNKKRALEALPMFVAAASVLDQSDEQDAANMKKCIEGMYWVHGWMLGSTIDAVKNHVIPRIEGYRDRMIDRYSHDDEAVQEVKAWIESSKREIDRVEAVRTESFSSDLN